MMQTLAIWRNVPNSMVCAIHKFKKLCCKCHRLGRFHETFKSKRSRGAHKGNLHTMLTCTLRSKRCTGAANNSKYSQGLLHIHAFCLIIESLCICVFVFVCDCVYMNACTLGVHCSISPFFPGAAIFPSSLEVGGIFQPEILPTNE